MKKIIALTLFALSMLLLSCNHETVHQPQSADISIFSNLIKATPGLTKQLVENDSYIDIDLFDLSDEIVKSIETSRALSTEKLDDIAKAKAAIYRFYSHITTTDNGYILDKCTAKDLNLSENLFATLKQNIEEMNQGIVQAQKEGKEIIIAPITQDYLNSLLQ